MLAAAFLLSGVLAFLEVYPTAACFDLQTGRGAAAWFWRTCSSPQANSAATWSIERKPGQNGEKTLSFQVGNAYPGYRLECDLYFANTGRVPLRVRGVSVINPHRGDLAISAVEAPVRGKTLQPCVRAPAWGANPNRVPAACRSKVHVSMRVGPDIQQNANFPFTIQVRLDEKR
jgi:hypothetical protein